jgi:hypothetical protein
MRPYQMQDHTTRLGQLVINCGSTKPPARRGPSLAPETSGNLHILTRLSENDSLNSVAAKRQDLQGKTCLLS